MLINNNSDNYINPAITTGIAAGGTFAGLGGGILYGNTLGVPITKRKQIKIAVNTAKQLGLNEGLNNKELRELVTTPIEASYKNKEYVAALKRALREKYGLIGAGLGTVAGVGGAVAYTKHKLSNNRNNK